MEGEEEGDERCQFEFEIGTDPIDLVQGAHDAVELYNHFERLETEALEDYCKHKAVQDQHRFPDREGPLEEIDEMRRRSRALSGKKLDPLVSAKIAKATVHYASKEYNEAIPLLREVVRLAPNVSDGYNLLGLVHDSLGDRKKAFNFHMIAAFFSREDASLWKKLVAWSIKMGDVALVKHRLSKAIIADPDDVGLKFDMALMHFNAGSF